MRPINQFSVSRRELLRLAGGVGVGLMAGATLAGCGGDDEPATTEADAGPPDPEAAKSEGALVVWHNDQEPDVVDFLAAFTAATGIETVQLKIAPAEALAKLRLEQEAGVSDVDIFAASPDVHHQLLNGDALLQYENEIMGEYEDRYKSSEPGYWTGYFVNVCPMIYIPSTLPESDAPKSYLDLLDPKWANQLQFPGPTSATGYNWWYTLKEILPADYFDQLTEQKPTVFASSNDGIAEMANGNKKIAGSMSIFQYTKALRRGEDLAFVADESGIPTSLNSVAIMKSSKRPNAAKMYVDFLLSEEGQNKWNNELQGSYAALPAASAPELPDYASLNLLVATDMDDYGSAERRAEFEELWSRVVGLV